MCGILFTVGGAAVSGGDFPTLLRRIAHRGPDETWHSVSENFSIGFTRLAIFQSKITLSSINAQQHPVWVLINGEIWNFAELAAEFAPELISSEYDLIRAGYLLHGIDYVSKLDGEFFIAIVDRPKNTAFFVRDPIGIRPAFYCSDERERTFCISSDIKPICELPIFAREPNVNYLRNRAVFHFSDYQDNILTGVRQIPPHCYLQLDLSPAESPRLRLHRFESRFLARVSPPSGSLEDQLSLLEQSVLNRYLHTESRPVGLLLSGGIDSSLLALIARRLGLEEIICFHLGPRESEDFQWATKIAERTGYPLEHIRPCASELLVNLPAYCSQLSGETGFIGPYLSFHIRRRHPRMKVVLCGEGSDELYGGYALFAGALEHFRELSRRIDASPWETPFIARIRALGSNLRDEERALKALLEFYLDEQLVNNHLLQLDHGFMAHALELRLPFLDLRNVQFARDIPLDRKISGIRRKAILKDLLEKVFGLKAAAFLERRKQGFPAAVPPTTVSLQDFAEALVPTLWAERHPHAPTFNSRFELMWFDLACHVLIRRCGESVDSFPIHDLYAPDHLSWLKGYLGA